MINRLPKTQSLRITLSGRNPSLTSSSAFSFWTVICYIYPYFSLSVFFFLHVNIEKLGNGDEVLRQIFLIMCISIFVQMFDLAHMCILLWLGPKHLNNRLAEILVVKCYEVLRSTAFINCDVYNWCFFNETLDKGMATHSSILAWRTPWTEEPGGLQYMGSHRVRHNWAIFTSL